MGKVERFEDLEVWQIGREICKELEELFVNTPLGRPNGKEFRIYHG